MSLVESRAVRNWRSIREGVTRGPGAGRVSPFHSEVNRQRRGNPHPENAKNLPRAIYEVLKSEEVGQR